MTRLNINLSLRRKIMAEKHGTKTEGKVAPARETATAKGTKDTAHNRR